MSTQPASPGASVVISAMVAVAVILTFIWPQSEPEESSVRIDWFEALPATSAGIARMERDTDGVTPVEWIEAAEQGEAWLASPDNADFQAMRATLTQALIESSRFDHFPDPVTIDLESLPHRETIKYLVETRPGVMSVIYYSEMSQEPAMVVYWPEVAGNQLVYTPLGGTSAEALSSWVKEQIAKVTPR